MVSLLLEPIVVTPETVARSTAADAPSVPTTKVLPVILSAEPSLDKYSPPLSKRYSLSTTRTSPSNTSRAVCAFVPVIFNTSLS